MKKTLVVSIVLNILLIVTIGVGFWQCRVVAFQMVADPTHYETSMQEHFLRELESGDTQRIESVKSEMSRNIEKGKKALQDLVYSKTGAPNTASHGTALPRRP